MAEENIIEKNIAKWLCFDHFCPSVKAEVIWDMLLSEFITDIMAFSYRVFDECEYKRENFHLLAKEFPVQTNDNDLQSAKADYLVALDRQDEHKIILVELKTTSGSVNDEQLKRYCKQSKDNIFGFYKKIINKYVTAGCYEKNPLEWQNSEKYVSQIMYMQEQLKDIITVTENAEKNILKQNEDFIEALNGHYKNMELVYLYVTKEKNEGLSVSAEKIRTGNPEERKKAVIYTAGSEDPEILNLVGEEDRRLFWQSLLRWIKAVNSYSNNYWAKKQKHEINTNIPQD